MAKAKIDEPVRPFHDAVVRAASERGVDAPRASSFEAVAGQGAIAVVEGHRVALGNARLRPARDGR